MTPITIEELNLINNLSARRYTGGSLKSNTTEIEHRVFHEIKNKLKSIAEYFAVKYDDDYGPFKTNVSPEANPITRGNTLHNVWSAFFKGAINKQYAAQISFVIDRKDPCINVGFYFGRASGHSTTMNDTKRASLENTLSELGIKLSNAIIQNEDFKLKYNSLFDLGFNAYSDIPVLPSDWYNIIRIDAKNSQITAKVYPNEFGIIENSVLDFYISQVIFLMSAFISISDITKARLIKPLTAEQYAKRAERTALIGLKGEIYVLKNEIEKLNRQGNFKKGYPRHVALESTHYGYDILSLDEVGNDVYIEVKTTTRKKEDPNSKAFYITHNEYEFYNKNKIYHKLIRVYDIEGDPTIEELDLDNVTIHSDGYIIKY